MNTNIICYSIIAGSLFLNACFSLSDEKKIEQNRIDDKNEKSAISTCNITLNELTFTHALNGADTCVNITGNGAMEFYCAEGLDFFCDPNGGKLSNTTLPILLIPVDNAKSFTLTAKVTPEFISEGLYNAADLFVYANDTLWQKLAFEQDEYGDHRIVSVRIAGTSDDSNHDTINNPRSEEQTSELQTPLIISFAVFCLRKNSHKSISNRFSFFKGNTTISFIVI